MSNKFDAKEINDQIDKLKPNLEIALTDLQGVGNSVTAILNNGEFTGEFATNVKSYYSEVHGKAIEVLHTLIDAVNTAGDKLKQNAQTVDSDGNAKIVTDYLLNEQTRDMQSVQEAYTHHKSAIQAQVSSIGDIVGISMPSENVGDATEQAKRELKNITQKVDDFANQSVVDEITSLLGSLDSLMGYMDGCQTAGGPGKYQTGDLGKQPWYNDLDTNMKVAKDEQLNESAATEETTKVLQSMSQEEQKKFYEEMCGKLGMPYTNEGFVEFTESVALGGIKLTKFWNKLFGTVTKNGYKADPTILSLISKKSDAEVFIEMIGQSEKMTDMFLNAAEKTEKAKLFVKNGAVDYLMNLALKSENMGEIVKSERYLKLATSIDEGTTIKNLKHAISLATETKDFSKASGWLKNIDELRQWTKDSKWIGKLGKVAKVLGWAGVIANTSLNTAENWEKTNGNVGRTISYTAIDALCDVGPLEGAQLGAIIGGPYGAILGFGAGILWQGAQWGTKNIPKLWGDEKGFDIKQGLKDTVGNWTGDKLNELGDVIKNKANEVGKAIEGAWNNITGGFHFGW